MAGLLHPGVSASDLPGAAPEPAPAHADTAPAVPPTAAEHMQALPEQLPDPNLVPVPEQAPAPAAPPGGGFDPSLMQQLANLGRGGGGGGPRPSAAPVRAADEELRRAQEAAMSQQAAVAEQARARGAALAEQYDAFEQRRAEQAVENARREAEARAEAQQRVDALDKAVKERYDLASEDGRSELLSGGNLGAALAVALGAFGAALTGGPNAALQVIDRRVRDEIEAKKRLIAAAEGRVSGAKDMVSLAYQKLGDIDAAGNAAMAQIYDTMALKSARHKEISGSDAVANNAEAVRAAMAERAAAARAEAARQVYEQQLKASRRGGLSLKARLDLQGKALDNAKKLRELQGGGAEAAGKLKIPEDTQKRLNSATTAKKQYENIIAAAKRLKKKGHEYIPSREGLRDLGEKAARGFARLPGAELFTDRGPQGMTPDQAYVAAAPLQAGMAGYLARTGQVADRAPERESVEKEAYGDGTLDGLIEASKRNIKELEATERGLLEMQAPATSSELQRNVARNPLPVVGTWEGAAEVIRGRDGGAPPTPGTRRVGR